MRRVVVTGVGVVAPNGIGKEAFWSACVEGRSGIGPIRCFDASAHPVRVAGEVPEFDAAAYIPHAHRKSLKIMGRAARFGVAAAGLAVRDSGLDLTRENPERLGVVMGSGLIPIDLPDVAPLVAKACDESGKLHPDRLGRQGSHALFPLWLLKYLPNMTAAHISLIHNAQGPNNTIVTACAAGTQAVGEAFRLIARGDADMVLAGGADSRLDPLLLLAYSALGAISPAQRPPAEVSRPFDGQRDGFVLGEGAGVLLLEELERAKRRGAVIYAEVLGLGSSFDAYAVTKPDPEARRRRARHPLGLERGPRRSRRRGLHQRPRHQHAAERPDGDDGGEARVRRGGAGVAAVVDQVDGRPPDRRGRGGGGGGAGADAARRASCRRPSTRPRPTRNAISITCRTAPARCRVRTAVSTSFGFGGQNAALVMRSIR